MPTYAQETQSGPVYGSDLLVGDGHLIVDRTIAASQTLAVGTVLGVDSATGQFKGVVTTVYESTGTGTAGGEDTFDLGHAGVDSGTVLATVEGVPTGDFTISIGTGTAGVDQIVLGTAPAENDAVVVHYKLTLATVAGVLYEATTTGVGETPTAPVVQSGQVRLSKLTGLPGKFNYVGCRVGGLVMEE